MYISISVIIDNKASLSGNNLEKRILKQHFFVFLLWLVSKKEMHGYEIIKTLKSDLTLPSVAVSKIYPLLGELCRKGFLSQRKVMHGKRARKAYHLTTKGKEALRKAKEHIRSSHLMLQFTREMMG